MEIHGYQLSLSLIHDRDRREYYGLRRFSKHLERKVFPPMLAQLKHRGFEKRLPCGPGAGATGTDFDLPRHDHGELAGTRMVGA